VCGVGMMLGRDVESLFQWDGTARDALRESLARNELENEVVRADDVTTMAGSGQPGEGVGRTKLRRT